MTLPKNGPRRPPNTTQSLRAAAEQYQAELQKARWRQMFGIDLAEWRVTPRGAWEVTRIGEAETHAGAEVGDLAVLCEVLDPLHDVDAGVKSRENFRGVYTSRSEPKVRCYYFRPFPDQP